MGDYRNKSWLKDQYVNQKKSIRQIAKEFSYGKTTIETWMKKHKIQRRGVNDPILRRIKELNKKWLIKQYINNKRSTYDIGKELEVSWRTINRYLDKFDIPKRSISENVSLDLPELNKKWLTKQYIDDNRSMEDIAIELNIGSSTVERYLSKFNIQIKTPYDYGRGMISAPHKHILIPQLENNGIKHKTSYILPKFEEQVSTAHSFEIDEFIPDHNIFLDLYGDYWHKLDKNMKTDRLKKRLIKKHYPDMIYLVIWEKEIRKNGIKKLLKLING